MAESSGPWDNAGFGLNNWQAMVKAWIGTGLLYFDENTCVVAAPGGAMTVTVNTGQAMIQGTWYHNDASKTLTISTADPSLPRIDRVVLHMDNSAKTITAQVLTGTPNASPSPPSLTQTGTVYEISLAQVRVNAGVTTITSGNLTDERIYCAAPNVASTPTAAGSHIYIQSTAPSAPVKWDLWFKTPF